MKYLFALLFFCLLNTARANDQMRDWTFESGEKIRAEITAFDEVTRLATLQSADEKTLTFEESEFSTIDRAWILQWVEQFEEAQAMLKKLGGTVMRYTTTGEFPTTYTVYTPETTSEKPPLLFLFHPSGQGGRVIYRYLQSAAELGVTLVSFDHFQNTGNDPVREGEMLERFTAILPQIEAAVPHDENRMFMGGTSGGAWRSYHYSAQVPRPWAGILASGGWLGGEPWYELPYPKLRVAMVNGDKDYGAIHAMKKDSEILQNRGSIVSVHAFEGGHQMPPPSVLTKGLRWLLESE